MGTGIQNPIISSFKLILVTESQYDWRVFVVNKLKCLGHIQKLGGTRNRNLKVINLKAVLCDGKKLSGQEHLTEKFSLNKVIAAVFYHCSAALS